MKKMDEWMVEVEKYEEEEHLDTPDFRERFVRLGWDAGLYFVWDKKHNIAYCFIDEVEEESVWELAEAYEQGKLQEYIKEHPVSVYDYYDMSERGQALVDKYVHGYTDE